MPTNAKHEQQKKENQDHQQKLIKKKKDKKGQKRADQRALHDASVMGTPGCITILLEATHAAAGMLLGNARLATLLLRQVASALQFLDFGVPTHGLIDPLGS